MKFRNIILDTDKTHVMGILNVTPDSFSDGGKFIGDKAIEHAMKMQEQGVAIIDIGGESTRPGFLPVAEEEEIARVVPVIEAIRKKSDIVISVDTMKAGTAKAALDAGADIVNDVSFMADSELIEVVAERGCGYCLMHNKPFDYTFANIINSVNEMPSEDHMNKWTDMFINDLSEGLEALKKAGVNMDKVMIDPGVGFSKGTRENILAIKATGQMNKLGYPVLLAVSRKSVIGNTLNLPVNERMEGTLALTAYAVMNNCNFVRVHDVMENVRVIKMLEAVKNSGLN